MAELDGCPWACVRERSGSKTPSKILDHCLLQVFGNLLPHCTSPGSGFLVWSYFIFKSLASTFLNFFPSGFTPLQFSGWWHPRFYSLLDVSNWM